MKDLLILVAAIAVAVFGWKLVSKKFTAMGYASWKVKLSSAATSAMAFLLTLIVLLPAPTETNAPQEVAAKDVAETVPSAAKAEAKLDPAAEAEKSQDALKAKIMKLKPEIKEVSLVADTIVITHLRKAIWDGKHWTSSFFFDALDIVKALPGISGASDFKKVTFLVRTPTQDQMGNEGDQLGMKVTYELAPFAKAKWSNMTAWNMANLPEDVYFKRFGLEGAIEYCKDEDNAKYATSFCLNAIKSARK